MTPCPCCSRTAPELAEVVSALDQRKRAICWSCFDSGAEPVSVVVNTANWTGWRAIPPEIKAAIRVFDLGEYVPMADWATRMSRRQLTVRMPEPEPEPTPAELEDADLLHLLDLQRRTIERMRAEDVPPPTIMERAAAWLVFWLFDTWRVTA